jgi:hypothetical protein
MQVPDYLRDCVSFVFAKAASGMKLMGTAYFANKAVPIIGEKRTGLTYAITARHVIEAVQKHTVDDKVYLRVNALAGGTNYCAIQIGEWKSHQSRNIDCAVTPFNLREDLVSKAIIMDYRLTGEQILQHEIGPGDDLFFPGLFIHHPGKEVNIPIVRTGTIAAMPSEVQTETQGLMRAYLIEARSIGGLSGSPVFLHLSGPRALRVQENSGAGWNHFIFFGMVQGHYGVRDILDAVEEDILVDRRTKSVNLGIALVVPADDIDRVLEQPEMVHAREKVATRWLAERKDDGSSSAQLDGKG